MHDPLVIKRLQKIITETLKLKCAFRLDTEQCEASLQVIVYNTCKDWHTTAVVLVSTILVHPLHFKLYLSECIGLVVNEIPPFKIQSEKFHFHS